ncbi:hypothetical protein [Streptomyces sp. NPDC056480]|uniref:hypothetical protein n=1 Tax=Streptomyces sp. NPDC056480 TaxID=3345833 RepID=UPI0036A87ECF
MTRQEWLIAQADPPSVTDWIQAIAGIVSALATIAAFAALWISIAAQREGRAEARLMSRVPSPELQPFLLRLEERFGDIIAEGGKPSAWFLALEQRREEQMLAAYAGLIMDDDLNQLVGQARAEYQSCFALAGSPEAVDLGRVQEQVDAARSGRSLVVKAIDRTNELVRIAKAGA